MYYLYRIPVIAEFTARNKKSRKARSDDDFDDTFFDDKKDDIEEKKSKKKKIKKPFVPSIDLDPEFFCSVVESLPTACMLENLLELWKFESKKINQLQKDDIIDTLNETTVSPFSGHEMNYEYLLGGIRRDESGRIISANAIIFRYMLYVNFSKTDSSKIGNLAGTEDWASESTMLWENKFINTMLKIKPILEKDDNITIFYSAGRR